MYFFPKRSYVFLENKDQLSDQIEFKILHEFNFNHWLLMLITFYRILAQYVSISAKFVFDVHIKKCKRFSRQVEVYTSSLAWKDDAWIFITSNLRKRFIIVKVGFSTSDHSANNVDFTMFSWRQSYSEFFHA